MIRKLKHFFREDLWSPSFLKKKGIQGFSYQGLRVFSLACHKFHTDQCTLRASALTYFILMAMVPLLALLFGIAHGFGYQEHLRTQILGHFTGQEDVVKEIIHFAENLLKNTQKGVIAGLSTLLFFWSVFRMIDHIEGCFNRIWSVKTPRSWKHKCASYVSILVIGPILFVLASSVSFFLVGKLKLYLLEIFLYPGLRFFLISFVQLLPYCLIWVLFTYMYMCLPNAKIHLKFAFFAALIFGTIYQLLQWVYILSQAGIARYNAIYGSFAVLPLFLFWVQISWYVFLMGAEVCYALHHARKKGEEK